MRKAFQGPTHGRLWCGVIYSCRDRSCLLGFQCSISLCPTMEEVCVLSKAKTKASVRSSCSILKSSPVQHPTSLVCFLLQSISASLFLEPVCALAQWSAMWLLGPQGHRQRTHEHTGQVQVTPARKSFFVPWDYISPLCHFDFCCLCVCLPGPH